MKKINVSRRNFIKGNAVVGLGALAFGAPNQSCAGNEREANDNVITKIGDWTLQELKDKLHAELFDQFIPNMDQYAIDHEYGGVMCSLDVRTGELTNMEKTAWFVGRGLWVYSFLYNHLHQDTRYLEIAEKSK